MKEVSLVVSQVLPEGHLGGFHALPCCPQAITRPVAASVEAAEILHDVSKFCVTLHTKYSFTLTSPLNKLNIEQIIQSMVKRKVWYSRYSRTYSQFIHWSLFETTVTIYCNSEVILQKRLLHPQPNRIRIFVLLCFQMSMTA